MLYLNWWKNPTVSKIIYLILSCKIVKFYKAYFNVKEEECMSVCLAIFHISLTSAVNSLLSKTYKKVLASFTQFGKGRGIQTLLPFTLRICCIND